MTTNARTRRVRHTWTVKVGHIRQRKCESHRKVGGSSRSMACEIRGVPECIACLIHMSSKPEEIFRHLLLPHKHARDAVT